jgi:GNAT superfamily N-acetyltransferase
MSRRARLTVSRAKNDEAAFGEILDMLIALHASGGYAPFNPEKAADAAFSTMCEDMCWVARIGGKPVGTLALTELAFWYADATFLNDAWFWVDPAHRAKDVGVALLKAAKSEAQARNKLLFVSMTNPDRRPKSTATTLVMQTAGFVPIGYTLSLSGNKTS